MIRRRGSAPPAPVAPLAPSRNVCDNCPVQWCVMNRQHPAGWVHTGGRTVFRCAVLHRGRR